MTGLMRTEQVRGVAMAAGIAAGVLVVTQLLLPGSATSAGTPAAVVFQGLCFGAVHALVATGIVLIHRSHRIINFAQGAIGAAGGVFTYNLTVLSNWPFLLAAAAGVLVAAGVAAAFELGFVRRFFYAPRLVMTVLTLAVIPASGMLSGFVTTLPIFPSVADRELGTLFGQAQMQLPFDGWTFQIGDLPLAFGFPHVLTLATAAAVLLGLATFLRATRMGAAIRAAAENAERAQMLGIGIGMISLTVWTISGALSGVGIVLQQAMSGQMLAPGDVNVLLVPLTAAVVARMRSIPVAVACAVAFGVLAEALRFSFERPEPALYPALLAVAVVGMLVQRQRAQRSEEVEASSWKAVQEHRPIPRELAAVAGVRLWSRVALGAIVAVVVVYPWAVPTAQVSAGGRAAIIGIAFLSLVVLTGWAGQVSLGQFALVAMGAVLGGAATSRWGMPFWLAVALVPFLVAGLSLVIGIPALRIRGLYLGVTTLAFAFAVREALFREAWFGWLLPDRVDRPTLFLIDFDDERSMYYLCVVALALTAAMVASLRRSRPGRTLIAVRDNEANAQSFAVDPVRLRLAAFMVAGWMCGLSGTLLAHHQRAVVGDEFAAVASLNLFLFAVVGGVGSIPGVLAGAGYQLALLLVTNPIARMVLGPVAVLAILYLAPGGLISVAMAARDGMLRIVAQRRGIAVPSLFADVDAQVLERRLIPLSEPAPGSGLSSLPHDQRYRKESALHGDVPSATSAHARTVRDTVALGAAMQRFTDETQPDPDDTP